MASSKTTLRTIRIKNETAAYFKSKPLNRYVDDLYECVQRGEIEEREDGLCVHTKKGKEGSECTHNIDSSVHIDENVLRDIDLMCTLSGTTINEFMKELQEAMENGYVMYDGGIVTKDVDGIDLGEFKDLCHLRHMDYQRTLKRCVQIIRET